MPNREDERYSNDKPRKPIRINPGEILCPFCGYVSIYYSEGKKKFICANYECKAEGNSLEDIENKKKQIEKLINEF
jgi:hypothetical protein